MPVRFVGDSISRPFGVPPAEDPSKYPGDPAYVDSNGKPNSFLMAAEETFVVRPARGRRLGAALVMGYPIRANEQKDVPLNFVLLHCNAAAMEARVPVLALGSNASPAQLYEKFYDSGVNGVVPVIRSSVHGIGIAASAHMSAYGAIPFAPHIAPGTDTSVMVCFFDEKQLKIIDGSELNYHRFHFVGESNALKFPSSEETLGEFDLYVSAHRVISQSVPLFEGQRTVSQADLAGILPAKSADLLEEALKSRASSALTTATRLRFSESLIEAGVVASDGFDEARNELAVPPQNVPYEFAASSFDFVASEAWNQGERVVLRSHDRRRDGDHLVAMRADDPAVPSVGHYVAVTANMHERPLSLLTRTSIDNGQSIKHRHVELDQVVRDSLGVLLKEHVLITEAIRTRRQFQTGFLPKQKILVMRSQPADLIGVELNICMMSSAALNILGVGQGDPVVLEGLATDKRRVRPLTLRAHEVPAIVMDRRRELEGGGFENRFPSARDALTVYPDLPWVFLDQQARTVLGLSVLSPVRVRAKRTFQVLKEIRELLIVLAVAAVALIAAVSAPWQKLTIGAFVVAGGAIAIYWRLRNRFS